MIRLLVLILGVILFLPFPALAVDVADNLTLILPSASFQYTLLSGSSFDSLDVSGDFFTFVMSPGQIVDITSVDRRHFNNTLNANTVCEVTQSSLRLSLAPSAPQQTITVTPTGTCSIGGGGSGSFNSDSSPSITPPVGGATILINKGAEVTKSSVVTLTLKASNAEKMTISNQRDFKGASLESYKLTKKWDFCSKFEDGLVKFLNCAEKTYTVYVKFYDPKGVASDVVSDSIIFKADKVVTPPPAKKAVTPPPANKVVTPPPANKVVTLPPANKVVTPPPASKVVTPPPAETAEKTPFLFKRFLGRGSRGVDVKKLQEFFSRDPVVYPRNLVTGYFGSLTVSNVKRFQERHGIAKPGIVGYGFVGPKTRAKLNELLR